MVSLGEMEMEMKSIQSFMIYIVQVETLSQSPFSNALPFCFPEGKQDDMPPNKIISCFQRLPDCCAPRAWQRFYERCLSWCCWSKVATTRGEGGDEICLTRWCFFLPMIFQTSFLFNDTSFQRVKMLGAQDEFPTRSSEQVPWILLFS